MLLIAHPLHSVIYNVYLFSWTGWIGKLDLWLFSLTFLSMYLLGMVTFSCTTIDQSLENATHCSRYNAHSSLSRILALKQANQELFGYWVLTQFSALSLIYSDTDSLYKWCLLKSKLFYVPQFWCANYSIIYIWRQCFLQECCLCDVSFYIDFGSIC